MLPAATAGRSELLVGDFNATLDHAEMRRLLDHGWADAADRTGDGLIGTWPADASPFPAVTLDHVLVSRTLGVRRTAVHEAAVLGPPGGARRAGAAAGLTDQEVTARRASAPTLPNAAVTSRS